MALLDKALEHVGDHLGRNPGLGRKVLDEIVAEPATGDVYRLETAGPSHSGKRVGHWPHHGVDGEVGPIVGETPARRERVEAAAPKNFVNVGGAAGPVQ